MKCIYCNKEREEFTKEHIIPKLIGGSLEPVNPFLINNVCRRCNNIAGLYIDAPFTKNWFLNSARASNAKKCVDLKSNPILPLKYMGTLSQLKHEKKICEYWMGPTGDGIYHFHEPYPEEKNIGIDGRPRNRKVEFDRGFVFLMIRSNNPEWHPSIIYSVIENFKGATFYLANGSPPEIQEFHVIPNELDPLHRHVLDLNGKKHSCDISISIGFEERFIAKIALGIGSKYLDDSFITSHEADLLRNFMHEKDRLKRKELGVRFTGVIPKMLEQDYNFMEDLTTWYGGHTILLLPTGDMLSLWANFYEVHSLGIAITSNRDHWKGKIDRSGLLFVLVPGLKKVVGPISLINLFAHKNKEDYYENTQLTELEGLIRENSVLPPVMI
jgi:hypothetical protein